jgi:hypothetical protein
MKKHLVAMGVAAVGSLLWASRADAQVVARETVTESGPNRALLSSGIISFGVPYVASVVVASQSDHQGDNHLYVPVAGPWMDLADRGGCGGLFQNSCNTETTYKVLLVANGILQGLGALDILASFVYPETTRVTVASDSKRVVVSPTVMGKEGYGVAAFAKF